MRGFGTFAAAFRAGLRPILICALIGAVAGLVWGLADEPEYAATATVIVVDRGEAADALGSGVVGGSGPDSAERLLELARSDEVAKLAAASLGGDVSGADLLSQTEFRIGDRGGTLVVRSEAGFADFAAAAANAFSGAVVQTAGLTEKRRLEGAAERYAEDLALVEPTSEEGLALSEKIAGVAALQAVGDPLRPGREAELPPDPENDRSAPLGAVAGFGLGALVAILALGAAELRRRPLRTPRQIAAVTGSEPVALLGRSDFARGSRRSGVLEPGRLAADRGAALLAALRLDREGAPGTLTVSSPMPGEGRTSVALALAGAAAAAGISTLLMEADMRRPALAELLVIDRGPGLSDYLAGEASPREVINAIPVAGAALPGGEPPSFVCVTSGTQAESPATLLSSSRFTALLDQLRRVYDLVVFDTPALLPAPESIIVNEDTDATLLCLRAGVSRRQELIRAREMLAGIRTVGTVLTGAPHSGPGVRRLPADRGPGFAARRIRR